jgi:hypothetical protein
MSTTKTFTNPILDAIPSRGESPSVEQENIMLKIRENSGIAIVQDKGTALFVLGPKYMSAEGVFVSKDRNPQFKADVIVMNTNANAAMWYSVLFHELAHATGTSDRLNRIGIMGTNIDAITYSYEEIIAESVALRIMRRLELDTPQTVEHSFKYINNYAMRIETLIRSNKLSQEIEAAENMVMIWLQGIEFKAA